MHKGIYQGSKGWYIQTSVTMNGQTRYATIRRGLNGSYKTKKEADQDYDRAIAQWISNHIDDGETIMWDKVVKDYLDFRFKKGLSIGTRRADELLIRKHLEPFFGNRTIGQAMKIENVKSFHSYVLGIQDISKERKNKIIAEFKRIAKYCYQNKYISSDNYQDIDIAAYQIKAGSKKSKERKAYSQDDINKLFSVMNPDTQDYVMIKLLFFLGCRIGEFQALKVSSIDFDHHVIKIDHQVIEGTGTGSYIYTDQLKTQDSEREDIITKEIEKMLVDYIYELRLKKDDFLFYGKDPLSRNTIRRKLYKYEDMAGLIHAVPHELRDTQATLLLSKCENMAEVKAVSTRLGHSMDVCLNIYQKLRAGDEQKILDKLYS